MTEKMMKCSPKIDDLRNMRDKCENKTFTVMRFGVHILKRKKSI